MNKVFLIGRLTRDPDVRCPQNEGGKSVARYTLAVDRNSSSDDSVDFISCVAFGKSADFVKKYLYKGDKIAVLGRISTGKYTNKDGQVVYTTDVIVESHEFAQSKNSDK